MRQWHFSPLWVGTWLNSYKFTSFPSPFHPKCIFKHFCFVHANKCMKFCSCCIPSLWARILKQLEERQDSIVCARWVRGRGRGRGRALGPGSPSWPGILSSAAELAPYEVTQDPLGWWLLTSCTRPACVSKVGGLGGAQCFSKLP